MEFRTQIEGIPCICKVTEYRPPVPITGTGYGDTNPPEDEVFSFEILDRKGYRAYWLERKVDTHVEFRLCHEYLKIREELNTCID